VDQEINKYKLIVLEQDNFSKECQFKWRLTTVNKAKEKILEKALKEVIRN